ncbi:MAG: lysozyme inhibitor LprI family protein, partial [Roseovarius sp.]|nr:lysozyme inhibitor LprI family protein [Roseovarius sp.]
MKRLIAALVLLPAPLAAQDPVFDIAPVTACLEAGGGQDCIGKAAELCIEATPGGSTTFGMGACTYQELSHWDGWLNGFYADLMSRLKAADAEALRYSSHAPKQAEALRDMQRAWI